MWSRLFPTFLPIRFSVYDLMLRSLIQIELSFVQVVKSDSIWILLHIVIQLDHLLKMLFSSVYFWLPYKETDIHGCVNYVWVFNSISLISMSVFMSIALQYKLNLGMVIPPAVLSFIRIVLVFLGFFVFPHEAENCPFKICKELC